MLLGVHNYDSLVVSGGGGVDDGDQQATVESMVVTAGPGGDGDDVRGSPKLAMKVVVHG